MTTTITPLIAGNWKMNGLMASLEELQILAGLLTTGEAPRALVVICPPATILSNVSAQGASAGIQTGGQDCHPSPSGAHTGDIAANMLADAGAQYVIVGHSERRANHAETDDLVRAKAEAAMGAGLKPIICVGETEAERDSGKAESVVATQLAGSIPDAAEQHDVIVAYEPVWAIGSGKAATPEQAEQVAARLRETLAEVLGEDVAAATRVLYGGSVKSANIASLMREPNIDGALVGGASLDVAEFASISRFSKHVGT